MTADDVTGRAARVINETNWRADFKGGARAVEMALALADAGLLATPERGAEVRADERAKVLAGFEVDAAPCGQTKWTPGADPLLKAIECGVPPTVHGDWHNADGHRWRVTDALPVLTSRTRLVGPWEGD